MPFWKADAAGRPLELGRTSASWSAACVTCRRPRRSSAWCGITTSTQQAAENLLRYLADQAAAAGVVPDDRTILIERCRDELGDWRICVLTPFGGRIHAPWAMAVVERARAETGLDVETMWTDDGFVVRFPETEEPPDPSLMIPASDEVEALVVRQLGGTALFAAKFREAAARALLLPKRRPGGRSPLWQQRKRAADLLAVAAQFGSFPMLLEAYRECLRDVFDMPALVDTLRRIEAARDQDGHRRFDDAVAVRVGAAVRLRRQLHLRRRRAAGRAPRPGAVRSIRRSCASCSARRSCASCSTPTRSPTSSASCSSCDPDHHARSVDGVHDLLLRLGDLTPEEVAARSRVDAHAARFASCCARGARSRSTSAASRACVPVEYAGRYRDALGVPLPVGLPESLLEPAPHAAQDLARRYARTHGPFTTRGVRRALRARPRNRRSAAEGARGVRPAARRGVPAGRIRPRVVRPGRPAVDPPPLAGEAAQAGRAGRPGGARPAARRAGRASSAARPASTRCSTRSRTCRARRCRRRSSRPRSWRRGSTATTRPISTR